MLESEVEQVRRPAYKIHPLLLNRCSPRSMTGEELSDDELMSLFEAARWAPSSYNNQPWRFIYAKRNRASWDRLFNVLADGNKIWCKDAATLVVLVSRKNFEYNEKPAITNQLDSGAAWENFALEATSRGLVAHGMQGFDYERTRRELEVPDGYEVLAMIAVGKRAPKEHLPTELQKREFPSDRKPLKEIVMEGKFIVS